MPTESCLEITKGHNFAKGHNSFITDITTEPRHGSIDMFESACSSYKTKSGNCKLVPSSVKILSLMAVSVRQQEMMEVKNNKTFQNLHITL